MTKRPKACKSVSLLSRVILLFVSASPQDRTGRRESLGTTLVKWKNVIITGTNINLKLSR